jgi:hypothetical protein
MQFATPNVALCMALRDCNTNEVEVEVNLRLTVSQSVLMPGLHLGPATNFSFSLKFPSDSCGFVIL